MNDDYYFDGDGGLDYSQFNLDSDLFAALEGANLGSEDMAALGDLLGGSDLAGLDPRDFQGPSEGDLLSMFYDQGMPLPNVDSGVNQDLLRELSQYNQDLGISPENMASYQDTMQDIMENRGGFTSGYQTGPNGERIMVRDDGTAIGINENGETYKLSEQQVANLIRGNAINTAKSGYFGATGGSEVAPGGGTPVTLKNGTTGTLMPSGKVINPDTGAVVGTAENVKGGIGTTSGNVGGISGGGNLSAALRNLLSGASGQGNLLGSLLPLFLMMMAMREKGGAGGKSSAVIPSLTATQKQTPYTQIQQAPGYRPGQGGITYFNPVQYAPRMASGGITDLARGRLLQGEGDGVSDSIPAMIGSDQPARLARGEYVVDARTVAELGNGSTDAGAERLDEMRKRVHSKRKKAKVGQDSKAYKALPA